MTCVLLHDVFNCRSVQAFIKGSHQAIPYRWGDVGPQGQFDIGCPSSTHGLPIIPTSMPAVI